MNAWDDTLTPETRLLFDAAGCIETANGPAEIVATLRHVASRHHLGLTQPDEYAQTLKLAAATLVEVAA